MPVKVSPRRITPEEEAEEEACPAAVGEVAAAKGPEEGEADERGLPILTASAAALRERAPQPPALPTEEPSKTLSLSPPFSEGSEAAAAEGAAATTQPPSAAKASSTCLGEGARVGVGGGAL